VVLLSSYQQAIDYPSGDIHLGFCEHCGFIANVLYDPKLQDYATDYEATQSYSPTFNKFAQQLAEQLIERYDLHNKQIIEIGCGQGEFLTMLCEMGSNHGIGFDPAYRDEPNTSAVANKMKFIADYYSEKYTAYRGDFIVCKMTLEHIDTTAEFIKTVRRSIGDNYDSIVFFQIPNGEYVMRDIAFWDVYYEHVSYFSKASLSYLFRDAGFDVLHMATEYNDQYLTIEAIPSKNPEQNVLVESADYTRIENMVNSFEQDVVTKINQWQKQLAAMREQNQKVVIWGSGSKGVSFLTTLGVREQIQYCVDINPRKHGMFMAGTGQEIVAPSLLQNYQPDVVIVMNPVYCEEIQADLDRMGVTATMITAED
jgi:2-polyprenyl-3-methyl-5-hydroxy-6-metoxy-1,4-benzoquinol methylase